MSPTPELVTAITASFKQEQQDVGGMSSDSHISHGNGGTDAAALLGFVHRTGKGITLKAGKRLFGEGEPCEEVYFVESGELELTIAAGEKKMTLGVACVGQLLALAPAIRRVDYPFSATAITECRVLFIEAEAMRTYLHQHPDTCLHTVQLLGSEILDLSSNMIRPLRLQPRYPKR